MTKCVSTSVLINTVSITTHNNGERENINGSPCHVAPSELKQKFEAEKIFLVKGIFKK